MSKKKNKKVNGDGPEKKANDDAAATANEQQHNKNDNNTPKAEEGQKKENNGGGGGNAVILKIDLHCEGCATKIVKFIRGFQGVETVKVDGSSGKITVNGKVDAAKLREKLEEKTHRKVELLSPVPKKDKENAKAKNDNGGEGKEEKKNDNNNNNTKNNKNNKKDEKNNSKEPQVTTAVLKVSLHCEGCIQKINKIVTKTKGCHEIKVDKQKDLVTVKGAMDMKELVENLKKHLKRDVEIVPPKKDDKKENGNGNGNGGGGGGGGGDKKAAAAAGNDGGESSTGVDKMQVQYGGQFGYAQAPAPPPYGYPSYPTSTTTYVHGAPAYVGGDPFQFQYHAPQMFSDENPNACTVM